MEEIQKSNLIMFERLIDIDMKSNKKQSQIIKQGKHYMKIRSSVDGASSILTVNESAEAMATKYINVLTGRNSQ